jgi:hypothetical protein
LNRRENQMRFMIMVKGNKDSEAGVRPEEKLFSEMADYHEQLAKAGVLLDASGLQPTSKGFRVRYSGGRRTVVDGPFTESKELIAGGYTLIQVKSREEALEGPSASRRRSESMRTPRSKCASSTSSRTSDRATQSSGSASSASRRRRSKTEVRSYCL